MHYAEGAFTGPSAEAHRFWGTVTAVAALGSWWLAARSRGPANGLRLVDGIVMLVLVSITGHHGGNLTHGTTFLSEYAPSFLRSLLGAAPQRPRPTSVAAADPYLDVVQPLLEQRCGTCHNEDKREGGFSVGTYDLTLVGGDTGRAFTPGDVPGSEALYRVSLPLDDDAHMPAEGKTPLTPEQIAILNWWVLAGAARDTTIGALDVPPDIEPLLAAQLGLGPAAAAATASATADARLVAELTSAGLLVRQVSQGDARLVVSVASPGTPLDATALAALAHAAPVIVDLNLADTDLDDAELASIGALPAATHLRLARNRLTDAALADLAALPSLEHLNLYGNAGITDGGIAALTQSRTLRELFVWQTAVTHDGAARLREQRPGLAVDLGFTPAP
jgi:mono/diheme cytochrome c family protein